MKNGKFIILYIDDDPDYRDAVRAILESDGYIMLEAASAEEGLRTYKQNTPDLIIVDLMMEEVDAGTGFVKELRMLGNEVPIYLLSSVGDHFNMSADYSDHGFAGIFQKPIAADRLLKVLKNKLSCV